MPRLLFALVSLLIVACGGSGKGADHASGAGPRPTCEQIDEACDPHEDEGGLAKQCHDLAESKDTPEATCVSRQTECLAACPVKK
jgi:hypothetical protein